MKRLHQKGDTIVEVLVALVIVSSVLVGAFSIANLSLKQIRMAQERTEAQKIAEGATEALNTMYATDSTIGQRTGDNDTNLAPFCRQAGTYVAEPTKLYVSDTDEPTNCKSGFVDLYHTAIVADRSNPKSFKIAVSWPGLTGRTERVELFYRIKDPE